MNKYRIRIYFRNYKYNTIYMPFFWPKNIKTNKFSPEPLNFTKVEIIYR